MRHAGDTFVAQELAEGAVAHLLAAHRRKQERAAPGTRRSVAQDVERASAERHAVLDTGFHAFCGDGPDRAGEVDLLPVGAANLCAAGSGQHEEPERKLGPGPSGRRIDGGKRRRDLAVRQGGVVSLALRVPAPVRQRCVRGVDRVVVAAALGNDQLEDRREPLPEPGRGLAPVVPQRAKNGRAFGAGHLVDGTRGEFRRIQAEGVAPLAGRTFWVAPGGRVAGDDPLDGLQHSGSCPAPMPWIPAAPDEAHVVQGLRASVGERDRRVPTEADVRLAAVDIDALLPRLHAGGVDVQGESEAPTAVAVSLHARLWENAGDERGGELFRG